MENNKWVIEYEKSINLAGNWVGVIGACTLIVYTIGLFNSIVSESYLLMSPSLIMMAKSLYTIVYGFKIAQSINKNTKKHIIIMFWLSLLLFVFTIMLGERPNGGTMIILYFMAMSWWKINKLLKNSEFLLSKEKLNNDNNKVKNEK
jgi:hypothetical protein